MRRPRALVLMLVAVLVASLAGTAIAQPGEGDGPPPAVLTVVHGIPDTPVDVWVNGEPAIPGFQPGDITDPIELPAGSYDLAVYAEGADPEEADPLLTADDVQVTPGLDATVVAHLDEEGSPAPLAIFVNDVSPAGEGEGRVAVHHTAAAPAVDVFLDGEVAIPGLANPDSAAAPLPAGTYETAVAVAGSPVEDAVIGPLDLPIEAGQLTLVYAVFSAEAGDLTALVQTRPLQADDEPGEPGEPAEREISRLEGPTRIETAVAVSQRAFPEGAPVVFLARADDFPDALAAGALTEGPILLVPQCGALPAAVAAEIDRLGADEVVGLGGVDAICDDVLSQAAAA